MLATDPDREGESISWHLLEVLKPKVPVRRIVLPRDHRRARSARRSPTSHDVDQNLVRAQESRRILDRLFGYTLSPVLWKKVQTGLSAGPRAERRGPADRRARGRTAARSGPACYWDLEARAARIDREFTATLARIGADRARHRQGLRRRDGQLATGARARLLAEADGPALVEALNAHLPWTVTAVEEETVHAAARAALHHLHAAAGSEPQARLLRRSHDADRAAAVPGRRAQRRPDGGLISYHRTGFDDALREGARRGAAAPSARCSAASITGAAPVSDEGA